MAAGQKPGKEQAPARRRGRLRDYASVSACRGYLAESSTDVEAGASCTAGQRFCVVGACYVVWFRMQQADEPYGDCEDHPGYTVPGKTVVSGGKEIVIEPRVVPAKRICDTITPK